MAFSEAAVLFLASESLHILLPYPRISFLPLSLADPTQASRFSWTATLHPLVYSAELVHPHNLLITQRT